MEPPVLVIWVIYFSPRHVLSAQTMVTYLLALGSCYWPRGGRTAAFALIIVLPFQGLLLAKLWSWGVPYRSSSIWAPGRKHWRLVSSLPAPGLLSLR